MNKNKKIPILVLGVFAILLVGGVYAYRGFALEKYYDADAYGVEISYPAAWKESPYQFHVAASGMEPGIIASSPGNKINVTVAPAYIGNVNAEHPESANLKAEAMLVSSTPLKNLPGVSAVQLVVHYYSDAGTAHYVARDVLLTDERLQTLGLQTNKMTAINSNETFSIKPTGNEPEVVVGFNSQEPLTVDQAAQWLKSADAQTAHSMLVAAKLK